MIDFGLAKQLNTEEKAFTYCGTPEYLAPEVVEEKGHTMAVDWWAVGILMYEMLIGKTPFFNRNRNELENKIRKSKVAWPDKKRYKIDYSDEFRDVVEKLLSKNPK